MTIEQIPEWHLSQTDDRAIAALLTCCFETDFGEQSYFIQRPHLRLIQRNAGTIIAHMALVFRAVRLGNKLVPICGLADVACAPDHRGRGIASDLLKRAITIARQSDAKFVLLFGEANLYAANGFQPMANTLHFTQLGPVQTTATAPDEKPPLMVLPLGATKWDEKSHMDLMGHLF